MKILSLLINSFVFSKPFYCSSVWKHPNIIYTHCSCYTTLLPELYQVQGSSTISLRDRDLLHGWMLRINGLAADYLGRYFVKRLAFHNKNTRGCNSFVVPRCRLSIGQRTFYFWCPRERNGLADSSKNIKKINSFKRILFNNMFHDK